MSGHNRNQSDNSFDVEELLQIGTRCKELRKEKDLWKESQSHSFGLIRRLELHVTSLSESSTEDKKRIGMLEKELLNCSQEIDYLQDQLNERDIEVNCLKEQVHNLELRLGDMGKLQDAVGSLREELNRSDSECMSLIQELENREAELRNSSLCIEKLRMSISSITLESQCEIESMKLDIVALEQNCIEAEKAQEEAFHENARMNQLFLELEAQFLDAQKTIRCLELENKRLREKLNTSETNFRIFWQRLEEWLEKNGSQHNIKLLVNELESKLTVSKDMRTCEAVSSPLIPKQEMVLRPDGDVMQKMTKQIEEYELLVKQLKEELREEKLKAKDETEDLAQEMAELRYQMTSLLEEERSRRACIEQASIQRISELEAQIQKERRDPIDNNVKHLPGV